MRAENVKSGLANAAMIVVLSFLAATTVAFFFVSVFLKDVATILLPDSTMFVAPLFIGFIFGLAAASYRVWKRTVSYS